MDPFLLGLGALAYIVVCGGAGTYVSMQKNRRPEEGALLGIFLGPFGVVAAACLPEIRDEPARIRPAMQRTLTRDDDDPQEQAEIERNLAKLWGNRK